MFSDLLCTQVKIKIYKTIILPVLYGCVKLDSHIKGQAQIKAFENRMSRISGSAMKQQEAEENCIIRNFIKY